MNYKKKMYILITCYCLIKLPLVKKNYKYFIGYLYDYKIKPLHIMLPKAKVCVKSLDNQIKWVYFLIEHNELLE